MTNQILTPRSDERRLRLVSTAYQLLVEKGFEGLRVREVAALVGINIATLHYYFPTKEDLIRGVVDYVVHLFLTIKAPLPQVDQETASLKLQRIFLDLQVQLQQAPHLFVVLTELHLRSQRDPAVRAILKNMNDSWQSQLEAICQEGVQQGLFRADLNPRLAASQIMALIKGVTLQTISQLDAFDLVRLGSEVEQWLATPGSASPASFKPVNRPAGRKGV
jgi:AcrR family transcriptional regulator